MFKSKKFYGLLITSIILVLALSTFVLAETSGSGYTTLPAKTTMDTGKVWTITLNNPVSKPTVNSQNVFVEDEKQNKIPVTLATAADGLSITVKPVRAYAEGTYKLYVTEGVLSEAGTALKPVVMTFNVTTQNYFTEIQAEYTPYVTNVKVTVDSVVYKVTVDGKEMHYQGGNKYSRGLAGVEKGQTLVLKAFDENGKLIQTREYTVN